MLMSMGLFGQSSGQAESPPEVVETVDINRYLGTWYEIAKIPNRFQRKCERNTTATYRLRDDGRIDVTNRCVTAEGDTSTANGIARVADPETNAKLEVSFVQILGFSLFWGDYWIIGLDENYDYAVVGHPDRKYGWILSREPELSDTQYQEVHSILGDNGYDPDRFEETLQTGW